MKNKKKNIFTLASCLISSVSFATADLVSPGPEVVVIPIVGIVIVIAFIVGAVFLARRIIKKMRNRQ